MGCHTRRNRSPEQFCLRGLFDLHLICRLLGFQTLRNTTNFQCGTNINLKKNLPDFKPPRPRQHHLVGEIAYLSFKSINSTNYPVVTQYALQ